MNCSLQTMKLTKFVQNRQCIALLGKMEEVNLYAEPSIPKIGLLRTKKVHNRP